MIRFKGQIVCNLSKECPYKTHGTRNNIRKVHTSYVPSIKGFFLFLPHNIICLLFKRVENRVLYSHSTVVKV